MANPRGPFRYDKPGFDLPGGFENNACNRISFNGISADNVRVTNWIRPNEGNVIWVKAPGSPWVECRITNVRYFTESQVRLDIINQYGICWAQEPDPGPITEWFISFYDPSKPPPYDETAVSQLSTPVVDTPTTVSTEAGSFAPSMDALPPVETVYIDEDNNEQYGWVEPQGKGHVVAVNDYRFGPAIPRLYVCVEFNTLPEDEALMGEVGLPVVSSFRYAPIDIDFPKIDRTTGQPVNPWSELVGGHSVRDVATED